MKTQKNTELNPFPVLDYIAPAYFCDRQEESQKIISAFENGRNVTLISIRRMGKTVLLKHVLHQLKQRKNTRLLYIDILATNNLSGFIKEFGNAIIKDEKQNQNFFENMQKFISAIRGKLVFDNITGAPSVELSYDDEQESITSLNAIFEYLAAKKEKYIIALDEFQQITAYPEKNIEALLRTHIQHQHKDNFVFSGSSKHTLVSMFSNYGRPFYQSSDLLSLEPIDKEIYGDFVKTHFENAGISIARNLIIKYITYFNKHTFYQQYFFNRLYDSAETIVEEKHFNYVANLIINERSDIFINYRNLLSTLQYKVLIAIAKEGGVTQINSGDFLRKHKLTQASSVSTAAKALIDKEMLYKDDNKYRVYDVFFEKWLQQKY